MTKEFTKDSKEFKLAAYELFQKIEAKQTAIEAAHKNLKDMAKAFGEFKRETLKEIFELRGQIASGAIQGSLI